MVDPKYICDECGEEMDVDCDICDDCSFSNAEDEADNEEDDE